MCFQMMPKLLWSRRWMTQIVRQWIPSCGTSSIKGTSVPKVLWWTRGTVSWWRAADHRWRWPATLETGTEWSARYAGTQFHRQRWTVTASLYWTRWGTSSQCRSSWSSCDSLHSYLPVLEMKRAAAFGTRCNWSVIDFGSRTELQ